MSNYKVALEIYNGPLDLLLFLIRRDEIDIYDIPISRITEQYLAYVQLLEQVDPDIVSEFLVLAATLIEIKSRTLLPNPPPEESQEEFVDPRLELVRQLLEYKKYKDAARGLEEAAELRATRHARAPALPPLPPDEVEIENVDIWNLLDAFQRVLQQIGKGEGVHQVTVDDTPIALHAADIVDSMERAGGAEDFEQIFAGRKRAEMIGLFLALLELIRQRRVRATQDRPFGPIRIVLLDARPLDQVPEDGPGPDASEPLLGELEPTADDRHADASEDDSAWVDRALGWSTDPEASAGDSLGPDRNDNAADEELGLENAINQPGNSANDSEPETQ